jgi:hypothetical protein
MKKSPFSQSAARGLILAALVLGSAQAGASQLIQNGGFEADAAGTYVPTGWNVTETMATGGVMVDNSMVSPASGWATSGAASGNNYSLLDSWYAGAFIMTQSFSTGAVSSATLSFNMFVNDNSADGVTYLRNSFDVQDYNDAYLPINYARVDLLKAGAAADATGSDIVTTFYLGGATGRKFQDQSNSYGDYTYDLSGILASGGNYTLRFASVSNTGSMVMGVDNVSLQVAAVPEPESYAMLLAGLGLIGVVARRRNRA